MFVSSATTAADFRKEVCDHLQREATAVFNRLRYLRRKRELGEKVTQKEMKETEREFHLLCNLRDFYLTMMVEGQQLEPGPR